MNHFGEILAMRTSIFATIVLALILSFGSVASANICSSVTGISAVTLYADDAAETKIETETSEEATVDDTAEEEEEEEPDCE